MAAAALYFYFAVEAIAPIAVVTIVTAAVVSGLLRSSRIVSGHLSAVRLDLN